MGLTKEAGRRIHEFVLTCQNDLRNSFLFSLYCQCGQLKIESEYDISYNLKRHTVRLSGFDTVKFVNKT